MQVTDVRYSIDYVLMNEQTGAMGDLYAQVDGWQNAVAVYKQLAENVNCVRLRVHRDDHTLYYIDKRSRPVAGAAQV